MANLIVNFAAKKLLGSQMEKYKNKQVGGDDDPFFAIVQDRHGKPCKVKKQIPDYIPPHDTDVLARAKSRAYHLDMSLFNLFGIRFGWSSVIGLVPAIGDVIDVYMAYRLVQRCQKVDGGLPAAVVSQMWLNVAVDFGIGLIPFIGDLVDAMFRCNTRNVAVLERHLKEKYGPKDKVARDRSGLEAFHDDVEPPPYVSRDTHHATYGTTDVNTANQSHYTETNIPAQAGKPRQQQQQQQQQPLPPQQSQAGGGYFGWFKKSKQPELEDGR